MDHQKTTSFDRGLSFLFSMYMFLDRSFLMDNKSAIIYKKEEVDLLELFLNQNERALLDLLLEIPPKYEDAESLIRETAVPADSIAKVAIRYAEECEGDVGDYFIEHMEPPGDISKAVPPPGIFPELHSTYIYDVIKLLLRYGLDPNAVFIFEWGSYNIMWEVKFIDNEYLGADVLALLLEHGGDPNLTIDGETLLDDTAFDVWFGSVEQEIRWRYDSWIHLWMVIVGYGGTCSEKTDWPKPFKGYDENGFYGKLFDIAQLKNHRNFYFGLSFEDGARTLHIYDKSTFWKVAEWR